MSPLDLFLHLKVHRNLKRYLPVIHELLSGFTVLKITVFAYDLLKKTLNTACNVEKFPKNFGFVF